MRSHLGKPRARATWSRTLLCSLIAGALAACGEPPKPKGSELRVLHLDGMAEESPEDTGFNAEARTHQALLAHIRELAKDGNVKGLFLHVGALQGSWARGAELRKAFDSVRAAKKPIHCFTEDSDNLGYALLAQVCDRISMSPAGLIDLVGVSAQTTYARELLQTLGVRADLVQIGRFKGAADAMTRDSMPDEVRQTLTALVDDLETALVNAIAERRAPSAAAAQALIDQGPFTSEKARAAGLIDDVGFDDAAIAHAKAAAKADRVHDEAQDEEREPPSLFSVLSALNSHERVKAEGQRVVVAYLSGTIMMGTDESPRSGHARAFVPAMRRFADDKDVKAVVLRIDSPGGSVLASDMMWHAVRRAAKRKPVIVSIGDMAASGGYYVASAGTRILAETNSIVGSIGVVGGKIVAEDLAARAGVRFELIARGRNAGWSSVTRAFTDEQRSTFEGILKSGYDRFLQRISEGRKLPTEQIAKLAEGRIMTAQRAHAGGLIDELGGLHEALARARGEAKLGAESALEVWPGRPSLMDSIGQLLGGGAEAAVRAALPSREHVGLVELLLAGEASQAAVLPFLLSLR